MSRSAGPRHADRLIGRILSVLLILCVFIIPVIAITLVQTTGTPRVIQTTMPLSSPAGTVQTVNTPITTATTTPVPTPAATLQTTQTLRPQATLTTVRMTTAATPAPTATFVPASTVRTIRQTYTSVMTGSPAIRETTPPPTGMATGTPRITGIVSGTAGTPVIIGTTSATGGISGIHPTFYGSVPRGTSGGPGAFLSSTGESPELASAIAGSFNQSRMHQASLQDVYLTSVGTSLASGSGAGAVSAGAGLYDADVTAVKKGDLKNNCPDDTISIKLRGMDPASPVAGTIASDGSQLIFSDPSIRTINIGNGMMTIESLRHAKLFGIFDLQYAEVSTITPESPVKIDRPFWVGLPGAQPQVSIAGDDPCAEPAMNRQGSGLTPGVTPTPAPEYGVNEVELSCPADPGCYPELAARCYQECLAQQNYSDYAGQVRAEVTCWEQSYDEVSYDCCIQQCIREASGRDQNAADQTSSDFERMDCIQKCEWNLALSILKETKEQQTSIIRNMG